MNCFQDKFVVKDIKISEKRQFDRVSRIQLSSEQQLSEIIIDINTDIFPIEVGSRFHIEITSEPSEDPGYEKVDKKRFANFDYVMFGKIYMTEEQMDDSIVVLVSFGGLLMKLKTSPSNLRSQDIKYKSNVYFMMRKLA